MKSVFHVLKRVAPTNIGVLIEGQSGTGKELFARAIHENSTRKNKQFIPINCAGLAESLLESELFGHSKGSFTGATVDRKGLFEIADKGTLFLDEIGDMPLPMQAKLLRVLEDGVIVPVGSNKPTVVDVRVISATNCDLAKLVEEKKFRQDLYFRIKGVSITLPPLRSRPADIPELFGFFLKEVSSELGMNITRITEAAMSILQGYDWPGNIRQLRHAIRTMVVLCDGDTLDVIDIPPEINRIKQLEGDVSPFARQVVGVQYPEIVGMSLEELEEMHIRNTLEMAQGNRSEAAKILKIGERTLYRKIKEYGL
jgi:two-component system response regulator HydG